MYDSFDNTYQVSLGSGSEHNLSGTATDVRAECFGTAFRVHAETLQPALVPCNVDRSVCVAFDQRIYCSSLPTGVWKWLMTQCVYVR